MADRFSLSRRSLITGVAAGWVLALLELEVLSPSAYAAAVGYNLPFTNLPESGAAIPTYDWRDGWHTRPNNGHHGIDFSNLDGQGSIVGRQIFPIYPGTVNGRYWSNELGNVVSVLQADGRQARYCHLASASVVSGTAVNASTVLGRLGATGTAQSGAHLHLELRPNPSSHDVDPWPFLEGAPFANNAQNGSSMSWDQIDDGTDRKGHDYRLGFLLGNLGRKIIYGLDGGMIYALRGTQLKYTSENMNPALRPGGSSNVGGTAGFSAEIGLTHTNERVERILNSTTDGLPRVFAELAALKASVDNMSR